VENGHYVLPTQPGYSARMFEESVAEWEFPTGGYWASAVGAAASAK